MKIKLKNLLLIFIIALNFKLSAQIMPDKMAEFYNDVIMSDNKTKKLDKAIKNNKSEPWYYWMYAKHYEIIGEDLKAKEYFEKSILIDSKFSAGHAGLSRFLYYSDSTKLDRALIHINSAIEIEPTEGQFYIDRGMIYLDLKEYDKAMSDANLASTKDADPLGVDKFKIEIFYKSGKKNELQKFLNENDLSEAGMFFSVDLSLKVGSLYEEMGQKGKACALYKSAAQPYEMFDEEVPSNLIEKLKKCK